MAESIRLQEAQNLLDQLHFVDQDWVRDIAQRDGFKMSKANKRSMRVVDGFVLKLTS